MDVTRHTITDLSICRDLESQIHGSPRGAGGASDGTRTRDLVLTKDVLYQLSYRGSVGAEDEGRTRDI
jgi:hypothetical protein